jgi:hypothetical protein
MILIAKEENSEYIVADCREMFPNTSFPTSGPTDEWLSQNGCFTVNQFKDHDPETQILLPCKPYLEGNVVYTVEISEKPVDVEENN